MIRVAVVPAAGLGTRLRPLTLAMPKETLPIVDKPAIHHIMESLKIAGIDEVIVVSGYKKHALMDYFSSPERESDDSVFSELNGLNIVFTTQNKPLGIADAIWRAKPFVKGRSFVVIFGDTLIQPADYLKQMVSVHERLKMKEEMFGATIGIMEVDNVERWGIVKLGKNVDECFEIVDMVEKPKKEEAPSNWAIAGVYVFEPSIFDAIEESLKRPPGVKGEYQLTDAMRILVKEMGFKIYGLPLNIAHYDLGTIEDYVATFVEFALHHKELGPKIRERLKKKGLL